MENQGFIEVKQTEKVEKVPRNTTLDNSASLPVMIAAFIAFLFGIIAQEFLLSVPLEDGE